jgi:two-component system KDP operon response regulator KdpE
VLVVDDDADVLGMLETVLAAEGFTVRTAASVAAARALLTETGWRPTVAVIDLLMQPEDGSQLAAWLRQIAPGVRIVMYSAWPEADALRILRHEMQADVFVAKPDTMANLIRVIRREAR